MMTLPIPVGYWSIQGNFCAIEELFGKAQLETTALAMQEACDAEIYYLTLNVNEWVNGADKQRTWFPVVEVNIWYWTYGWYAEYAAPDS